ncbi:MAG: Rid family detoxifying hydrolase [Planctomycetota bacterium]|nr:Rid family detoxifying hydrolase [Planctomycetota bacterium]
MRTVHTSHAPAAIGPYSQALIAGGFVFTSGQIALDPETGVLVGTDAAAQAQQVFANLRAVLEASGSGLAKVIKTTVFLADMKDFVAVNAVYAEAFGAHKPARSTIQAAGLPKAALVEIECVAQLAD